MSQKAIGGVLILLGLIGAMAWVFVLVRRVTQSTFVRGVVGGGFLLLIVAVLWSIQIVATQQGLSGLSDYFSATVDLAIEWAKPSL